MASLIAYFSRTGENYVSGALKELKVGNTEVAAKFLQEITVGELFKIEPTVPYSDDYNECIEEAKDDQRRNARPEIKSYPDSIDKYDTIYLGYPNYWSTMPMHVFTFLEKFDFTGKTIKPFCTHEGSGMGRSESDIKKLCPGAKVEKGIAIHGTSVGNSKDALKKWA